MILCRGSVAFVALLGVPLQHQLVDASVAADGAASAADAIPSWRVDAAMHPTEVTVRSLKEGERKMSKRGKAQSNLQPIGSSVGQDRQRCPVVRLPATLLMLADQSDWTGQSGSWEGGGGGNTKLAHWGQNYFSQAWQTLYVKDQDGNLAVKAVIRSQSDLGELYGWVPGPGIKEYPKVSSMAAKSRSTIYHGYRIVNVQPNEVEVRSTITKNKSSEVLVAFTDCESQLLFVARLEVPTEKNRPAAITILDRAGGFVAEGIIDDPSVARYQFVDPAGYLIAVAETPALHNNISMKAVPRDSTKGDILPYALRFETGGYTNASRLLDLEYRWVLALAVQARAVMDARPMEAPTLSEAITAFYWSLCMLGFILFLCMFGVIFRLVYPPEHLAPLGKLGVYRPQNYASIVSQPQNA